MQGPRVKALRMQGLQMPCLALAVIVLAVLELLPRIFGGSTLVGRGWRHRRLRARPNPSNFASTSVEIKYHENRDSCTRAWLQPRPSIRSSKTQQLESRDFSEALAKNFASEKSRFSSITKTEIGVVGRGCSHARVQLSAFS